MRIARLLPISPSIHCSGGECTGPGGVPGPRGCTWSWGVNLVPEGVPGLGGGLVYLVWGGVPGPGGCTCPGGVPGPRGWVYLVLGDVPGPRGVYLPGAGGGGYLLGGCTCRGGTCPGTPPPVNRMTERQVQNITLPQTSFAGGNNNLAFRVYSQLASKSHRFFLHRWNAFLWCCLQITLKSAADTNGKCEWTFIRTTTTTKTVLGRVSVGMGS